jgi:hypothetical protein
MDLAWVHRIERMPDNELAEAIIAELAGLEAQGVALPAGWSSRPVSLLDLNALIEIARAQLASPLFGLDPKAAALH